MLYLFFSVASAACPWKGVAYSEVTAHRIEVSSDTTSWSYLLPEQEGVFLADLDLCRGMVGVAAYEKWHSQFTRARFTTGLVGLVPLGVVTLLAGDPGFVLGAGIGAGVNAGIQWKAAARDREALELVLR